MKTPPPDQETPAQTKARQRRRQLGIAILILLIILLLLWLLRGCSQAPDPEDRDKSTTTTTASGTPLAKDGKRKSSEEKTEDEPTDGEAGPADLLLDEGLARGSGEGVEEALAAMRGMEDAMRNNKGALPVGPTEPSPLALHLPSSLAGHPMVESTSSRTAFQGKQGQLGFVRASYGSENSPHITLTLSDAGLAAAGARIQEFLSGAESVETATEVRRSGRRDGRPFQLAWRANPKKASATILVSSRLTAEIFIEGADSIEIAEKALDELPLDELDALVKSTPRKDGSDEDFGVTDIESVIGGVLLDQTPSSAEDAGGPGPVPEALIAALPGRIADLPQVLRRGSSGNPGSAHPTPYATSEYAGEEEGSPRYRLTLETSPTLLGMLSLPQRTWDRMASLRQPNQQLLMQGNRRMTIIQQPTRSAAEAKILLSPKAMLTLNAEGFKDAEAAAEAALAAIRSLDIDALDTAARAALTPSPSPPPQ